MRLIRVVAPHFVAGFESDGTVRRAAPILGFMTGWSDDRARVYMAAKGWRASVIGEDLVLEPSQCSAGEEAKNASSDGALSSSRPRSREVGGGTSRGLKDGVWTGQRRRHMPHDLIEDRTLVFDGGERHYGDIFQRCRLVLKDHADPLFLNCIFVGCEFEPPLPVDGRGGGWLDRMYGAVIQPGGFTEGTV